jgi:hypothetical protein
VSWIRNVLCDFCCRLVVRVFCKTDRNIKWFRYCQIVVKTIAKTNLRLTFKSSSSGTTLAPLICPDLTSGNRKWLSCHPCSNFIDLWAMYDKRIWPNIAVGQFLSDMSVNDTMKASIRRLRTDANEIKAGCFDVKLYLWGAVFRRGSLRKAASYRGTSLVI